MQYAGKLFGAFQKMHAPEDFPGGRGIGLATVQRIVARHNGIVRADAAPQQGAAFAFTLRGPGAAGASPEAGAHYAAGGWAVPGPERVASPRQSTGAL